MKIRKLIIAAAAVSGLAAAVAGPVMAQPKDPVAQQGCTWNGASYSHGGVHTESFTINGRKYHRDYTCENGAWVSGTLVADRVAPPTTSRDVTVSRGATRAVKR